MSPTVVIAEALDQPCVDWLAERAEVVFCPHRNDEQLRRELGRADGLVIRTYTRVDDAFLDRAPRLKVIGRAGVGLDNLDLEACQRRGLVVVYTPDANMEAVAEYVLGLMLDDLRPRVHLEGPVDSDTFHTIRREKVGTQLDQLTLGILGFGRIGKRLGRIAHAIGMTLLVNDLLPEPDLRSAVDFPFEFVDKPTLYHGSDILSIHVDGRPSNRNLIDADALALLGTDCLLINAARGLLIDNTALKQWADAVRDTGGRAALDVHEPEPIPEDYPLFGLPNVRILPHLASRTRTAVENMCWVVRDVWAVLEGEAPKFPAY